MGKNEQNRREFLKKASLGLLGGYAALKTGPALAGMMGGSGGGGCGGGGGGCGGGGGGVIDPPLGGTFQDPAAFTYNRTSEIINDVARYVTTVNLEVFNDKPVNINGVMANLMTYNGCFPAPTISVKKGDILRVNLKNSMKGPFGLNLLGHPQGPTNLHTHGWHVSPKAISLNPPVYSDYVMYSLSPGNSCVHQYDTSMEESSGFHFYHPHLHGISAEQYWAGLVGALTTTDDDQFQKVLTDNNIQTTHIMVLKDISLSGADPAPHASMMDYMHGMEGDIVMVNGQVNPLLTIQPGEVQRWRILNASNARWYKLSLTNHQMHLIGTDGNLLNIPYPRDQILMSPGERVDILVKASSTKADYKLLSLPYSRMGMMTSAQITLLTMRVSPGTAPSGSIPKSINPNIKKLSVDPSMCTQRTMALSMGQGAGYINGIQFVSMDQSYSITTKMIPSYEIWTITNQSGMDHPFHQHVDHAQVLSISGADSSYPPYASMPAWKDVVLIPKMGSAKLLVPVKDFNGMTMFHCHILEHEDIGMMGVWQRGM